MQEDLDHLFREIMEARKSGEIEKVLSYLADDIVVEDTAMGKTLHGKVELMKHGEMLSKAFSNAQPIRFDHLVSGDTVVVYGTAKANHYGDFLGYPATGREVEFRVCEVLRFQEGKLQHVRAYYNLFGILTQIGALEHLKAA